ncbi:hypothetical protein SDC9_204030 [bioreactor metagenome]|uniref:Uncharacterized protein n=1 Tax=bioreactor metagenome TaxID=1076179 RepID=A0A645IZP6_9ZZZZ
MMYCARSGRQNAALRVIVSICRYLLDRFEGKRPIFTLLLFDGPLREPADHQFLLEQDKQDNDWNQREKRRGKHPLPAGCVLPVQALQQQRQRHHGFIRANENFSGKILFPEPLQRENAHRADGGFGKRQHHFKKDRSVTAAVHDDGFGKRVRQTSKEVP